MYSNGFYRGSPSHEPPSPPPPPAPPHHHHQHHHHQNHHNPHHQHQNQTIAINELPTVTAATKSKPNLNSGNYMNVMPMTVVDNNVHQYNNTQRRKYFPPVPSEQQSIHDFNSNEYSQRDRYRDEYFQTVTPPTQSLANASIPTPQPPSLVATSIPSIIVAPISSLQGDFDTHKSYRSHRHHQYDSRIYGNNEYTQRGGRCREDYFTKGTASSPPSLSGYESLGRNSKTILSSTPPPTQSTLPSTVRPSLSLQSSPHHLRLQQQIHERHHHQQLRLQEQQQQQQHHNHHQQQQQQQQQSQSHHQSLPPHKQLQHHRQHMYIADQTSTLQRRSSLISSQHDESLLYSQTDSPQRLPIKQTSPMRQRHMSPITQRHMLSLPRESVLSSSTMPSIAMQRRSSATPQESLSTIIPKQMSPIRQQRLISNDYPLQQISQNRIASTIEQHHQYEQEHQQQSQHIHQQLKQFSSIAQRQSSSTLSQQHIENHRLQQNMSPSNAHQFSSKSTQQQMKNEQHHFQMEAQTLPKSTPMLSQRQMLSMTQNESSSSLSQYDSNASTTAQYHQTKQQQQQQQHHHHNHGSHQLVEQNQENNFKNIPLHRQSISPEPSTASSTSSYHSLKHHQMKSEHMITQRQTLSILQPQQQQQKQPTQFGIISDNQQYHLKQYQEQLEQKQQHPQPQSSNVHHSTPQRSSHQSWMPINDPSTCSRQDQQLEQISRNQLNSNVTQCDITIKSSTIEEHQKQQFSQEYSKQQQSSCGTANSNGSSTSFNSHLQRQLSSTTLQILDQNDIKSLPLLSTSGQRQDSPQITEQFTEQRQRQIDLKKQLQEHQQKQQQLKQRIQQQQLKRQLLMQQPVLHQDKQVISSVATHPQPTTVIIDHQQQLQTSILMSKQLRKDQADQLKMKLQLQVQLKQQQLKQKLQILQQQQRDQPLHIQLKQQQLIRDQLIQHRQRQLDKLKQRQLLTSTHQQHQQQQQQQHQSTQHHQQESTNCQQFVFATVESENVQQQQQNSSHTHQKPHTIRLPYGNFSTALYTVHKVVTTSQIQASLIPVTADNQNDGSTVLIPSQLNFNDVLKQLPAPSISTIYSTPPVQKKCDTSQPTASISKILLNQHHKQSSTTVCGTSEMCTSLTGTSRNAFRRAYTQTEPTAFNAPTTSSSTTISRQLQNVIPTCVYLMSNVAVHMEIEGTSTCPAQVMLAAAIGCQELGIANKLLAQSVFALWMISPLLEIQLKAEHRPYEVRIKWPEILKKRSNRNPMEKFRDDPMITLKRSVFLMKKEEEKIKDHRILELLYEEARFNVLTGRYVMEPAHLIMLGGIQSRIELGPYNGEAHTITYFRENQCKYLPSHIAKSTNWSWLPISWKTSAELALFEQFKRVPNAAPAKKLMRKYLEFCWALPYYGAAFFHGQVEQPVRGLMSFFNNKDISILVAINEKGIFIIDKMESTLLLGIRYEELSWDFAKPSLIKDDDCLPCIFIQFNVNENGSTVSKLMQIFSKQAIMMDALIAHFTGKMRARRKSMNAQIYNHLTPPEEPFPIQNNGIGVLSNKLSRLTFATFDADGRCIGQMGSIRVSY